MTNKWKKHPFLDEYWGIVIIIIEKINKYELKNTTFKRLFTTELVSNRKNNSNNENYYWKNGKTINKVGIKNITIFEY